MYALKCLFLSTVLAVVLPIYGQQETPKTDNQQNHTDTPNKRSPGPIGQEAPKAGSDNTAEHAEGYFSRLFSPGNLPNIGLILVGAIGIFVAISTLRHMQESSERQLRAYTLPESGMMLDGTILTPPQPLRAGVPGAAMWIKNGGQTPAYRVCSWMGIAVIFPRDENNLRHPPIPEQFTNTLRWRLRILERVLA